MNWLAAIVKGFFAALFGWGQTQAEKPATLKDAETPQSVKDELNQAEADFEKNLPKEK